MGKPKDSFESNPATLDIVNKGMNYIGHAFHGRNETSI